MADEQQDAPTPISSPMVARISPKIPSFWAANPELWFAQVEAQFFLAGITDNKTKYSYVISSLEQRFAMEVQDIISQPPSDTSYDTLKTELIRRLSVSEEKKIRKVLLEEDLGDRTPSQFLRHLKSLSSATAVGDQLLKTLWVQRLPPHIQGILQTQQDLPCDRLAIIADKILEVQPITSTLPNVAAVTYSDTQITLLTEQIKNLTVQVSKLVAHVMSTTNSVPPKPRYRSISRSSSSQHSTMCWYHRKYGLQAHRCVQPCNFNPGNNNKENSNDDH